MEKRHITWSIIDSLVNIIARDILSKDINIYNIYGIPRGGLIPAVLLSHKLGIPITQELKSYSLVVDDISDSGSTLRKILDRCDNPVYNLREVYTATLYEREDTIVNPDFVGLHVKYNDWLVFPWENKMNASQDKAEYENKPHIAENSPKKFPRDLPFLKQKGERDANT